MTYKSKNIVVTGGGGGIGRLIALQYAKLGARIIVIDESDKTGRETVDLIYDYNGKAIFLKSDCLNMESVEQTMEKTIHMYGAIDVLVNCIGYDKKEPILEMEISEWNHLLSQSTTEVLAYVKEASKYMKIIGRGSIVNVLTRASYHDLSDDSTYDMIQGSLSQLTKSLSLTLDQYNIQINCITSGVIDLRAVRRLKNVKDSNPLDMTHYSGEDIARACVHLTDEANAYVNGSNLILENGFIRKLVYV